MAPSSMFSYLRPGHAKRNATTLPVPEPLASPAAAAACPPPPSPSQQNAEFLSSPRFSDTASHASASPISPFPPQLPPITRVASKLEATTSPTVTRSPPVYDLAGADSHVVRQKKEQAQQHAATTTTSTTTPPALSSAHLGPSTISPSYPGFSKSQTSQLGGLGEKLSSSSKPAPNSTPTPAPAKSKSRLTLRNPMSLLMRRRSAQSLDRLADESLVTIRPPTASLSMPDNYDPSIRGNIVHDFNAPRLNRNYSYNNNTSGASDAPQDMGRVSPSKIDREHTPVFHEHFDDDTSYEQSQAAIRAETLVNKDFLARNSVQFAPSTTSPFPQTPPPIPKEPTPIQTSSPPPRPTYQAFDSGSTVLSPVQETPSPGADSVQVTPNKRQSTKSPPSARSRATSVTDPSFQPAGLPTHLSSRASRFSFQTPGGSDSAQEKLLEERHKAKAAEKASQDVRKSTNSFGDDFDEYDMDDYDMDGGYDEEIPMVGEEDEFEGLGNQTLHSGFEGFDFSSAQAGAHEFGNTLSELQQGSDYNGNGNGPAMNEETIQQFNALAMGPGPNESVDAMANVHDSSVGGSQELSNSLSPPTARCLSGGATAGTGQAHGSNTLDLGDDMYFDDGLIGDQEDVEPAAFDEDVFDDPEGPLYERKVKFSEVDGASTLHPNAMMSSETGYEADDDTIFKHLGKSEPSLAHRTSVAQQRALPDFNDMNTYYSALADAANRAEASGRFTRKNSVEIAHASSDIDEFSMRSTSRPSLIPDDGRPSLDTDVFPPEDDIFGMSSGYVDDYDYSDFDSAMEDDPIIAAANAEALAYDDEGFYGQEFGFYASGAGESSSMWGGFFGSSGLGRAPSGRNAVREPALTPITERSEYSTRNSFISLNHFRDGNQPLSSPGLAQLARMSPYGWPESSEDMSFDALMKLRKGAFGGSVASLPGSSSGSPRNSSPMGMQFVPRSSSPAGKRMMEHAGNVDSHEGVEEGLPDSAQAPYEEEDTEDDDDDDDDDLARPESPTLNASEYQSLSSPARHSVGNEAPLLPPISELYAQYQEQMASNPSVPLSPGGLTLTSAANVTLPSSPHETPLSSPTLAQNRPPAPPSIDTAVSSAPGTTSNSTGPRRQSVGFVSPISSSSPLTPSGSAWRGGHSRKGSAADSVTYVREHDASGEGRWVLERRRTAESGELELVGREVVEGGRI